ncbi:MAG: hypothetical protein Q9162_002911 [Coniocarpon cinnabarinum]
MNLGHTIAFLTDYGSTITNGRMYFGNSRRPFFFNSSGVKALFITSASDAAQLHRDAATFKHYEFLKSLISAMGVSKVSTAKLWDTPHSAALHNLSDVKPQQESQEALALRLLTMLRKELAPGSSEDDLPNKVMRANLEYIDWNSMHCIDRLTNGDNDRVVSLTAWTRRSFGFGVSRALFGEALLNLEPNLLDSLFDFDDKSWMLVFEIPRPWSNKVFRKIGEVKAALKRYFELPQQERADASCLVKKMEADMRNEDIDLADIAVYGLVVLWGSTTNVWKVCFWLLGYVARDVELQKKIKDEIDPTLAAYENTQLSPSDLSSGLQKCPQLLSVYHEVMRLTSFSGSIRHSSRATNFVGYDIAAGTKVVIPYREMFMDKDVFGLNADTFQWNRFLGSKRRALTRSQSYRPFGGGVGLCPGRFISQSEILTFVSRVIGKYDLRCHEGRDLPAVETKKLSLGIMGPANGEDVMLSVRRRSSQDAEAEQAQ